MSNTKITEKNIIDVQFNPDSHYLRSDLTIVNKEEWNSRGLFTILWHWIIGLNIDGLAAAKKLQRFVEAHHIALMVPETQVTQLKAGLLKQVDGTAASVTDIFNATFFALWNEYQVEDGYLFPLQ